MVKPLLMAMILVGCTTTQIPSLDTTICDPKDQQPCFSVSPEFVERYFEYRDMNTRMKTALKHCQEKL